MYTLQNMEEGEGGGEEGRLAEFKRWNMCPCYHGDEAEQTQIKFKKTNHNYEEKSHRTA